MIRENDTPVLACMIDAILKEQRPLHRASAERLIASTQAIRALPMGYAWRLPNEADLLQTIATFISYERLCCPFLHFNLAVEPNQGPLWFSITANVDVKTFLESEGFVPERLINAAAEM
jgi:hypothetical protein